MGVHRSHSMMPVRTQLPDRRESNPVKAPCRSGGFFFVSCGIHRSFCVVERVVDNSSLKPRAEASNLRAVVEVVPVVAGAHPVVVGGGVVGLVVGVSRGVVELAGLGVLAGGLGVEGGGGLTVKSLEPAN